MYRRWFLCACVSFMAIGGCAVHKQAVLSTPQGQALAASQAKALEARSLDDPQLRQWMTTSAGVQPASWPLTNWDLSELTLAAYYFNPEMDVARANAAVSDAAIITAAMKPNPSISFGSGYETALESPYLLMFDFSLPIETAGKRGYRIAEAQHLSAAGRIQVAATAWAVRSHVRAAMVNFVLAEELAALLQKQESEQSKYVELLVARFRAGEIPLPDVTSARIDLTNLRQALRTAEGQVGTAHSAVAAAIGIPDSSLRGKNLNWSAIDQPPNPGTLAAPEIRAAAIENRLDVKRSLAQFEAAQSRLQLELARRHPDIHLGPGYAFEEGAHLISLQLGAVLPLRNRNEGPIAEAEAQRKAAGVQLLSTQSTVIADSDKALAQYNAAFSVLEEARRSTTQAEQQRQTANQWLKSGEADQLTAISADIQAEVAERARLQAIQQVQLALGSLEDALQRPVDPASTPALPKKSPR